MAAAKEASRSRGFSPELLCQQPRYFPGDSPMSNSLTDGSCLMFRLIVQYF